MCLAYTSYDSLTLSVRDSLEELDQANCSMINIEVSKKIANIDVLESKLRTEKALQCALESEDKDLIFQIYTNVGDLYFRRWGEVDEGILFYEKSITYASGYVDSSHVLNSLGILHGEKGELDRALDYFHQSLALIEPHEMSLNIIIRKANIAKVYEFAGDVEKSLDYYNQILNEKTGTLDSMYRASYLRMVARLHKSQGKLNESEAMALQVIDLLPQKKSTLSGLEQDILNQIYLLLSDINIENNRIDQATKYAAKALDLGEKIKNIEHIQSAQLKLLNLDLLTGKNKSTINSGLELISDLNKSNSKLRLYNAHLIVSKAYKESLKYEEALYHYMQYDSIFNEVNSEKAKTNILLTEQKSIEKQNENLRYSEQYYKQQADKRFFTISLLSVIAAFMLGLIFLLLKIKKQNTNLTAELQNKNKELENYINSNIKLEQFAHLASHDMKSPLRAISSYTQLLKVKNEDNLNPKSLDYMSFIESATNRLFNLVNDLLDYSKVNSQVLNVSKFEIEPLLAEIKEDLDFEIKNHGGIKKINSNNQIIQGDRQKLKQVFMNLLNNSLKFSLEDTPVVVNIDVVEMLDKIKISVSDNGIGIDKEFHEKMFLPYSRYYRQDEYEGTGLGLTIVKKIIDKHEGNINCKSKEGQGTTFEITLPYRQSA
jgi:signal transduction histidine kinase